MAARSKLTALAMSALRAQPDSRLVRLARDGHDAAMEEIVRRYRPALVGYAARIVPAHRAEDVVQEALSRAMVALVGSENELKLKPWLYVIVRNRALNDLRDERTHVEIPEDFDGVPQPPEVVARSEEISTLVAAIGELPDGQREALVQRELEGRSHEEIASRLGSTPGAIRGLIFRARLTLRDAAGLLLPLPVLRWMLTEGAGSTAAAAGTAGAGGAAIAGAAGGGGGIAAKTGTAFVVATLALGSGVALRDEGRDAGAEAAASGQPGGDGTGAATPGSEGAGSLGSSGPSSSSGPGGGDEDEGDDDSSGPGDGGENDEDNSGPGGGEGDDDNGGHGGGDEDNSGPGSGGSTGHGGSGSSGHGGGGSGGPGGGGGADEDNSGPGGGGSSGPGGGDEDEDEDNSGPGGGGGSGPNVSEDV